MPTTDQSRAVNDLPAELQVAHHALIARAMNTNLPPTTMFAGITKWGLFTIRPSVSQEYGRLVLRTSLMTRLFGLFTHLRRVTFCPVKQAVMHEVRTFWFIKDSIEVPFKEVSHLEYISGSSETGYSESAEGFDAKDAPREYSLALATKANNLIEICTFCGGAPPGKGKSDQPPAEPSEPGAIVAQLSTLLGIELKSGAVNRKQMFTRCGKCGRKVSRYASVCLYCKE